jgi:hypothetical protein
MIRVRVAEGTQVVYRDHLFAAGEVIEADGEDKTEVRAWIAAGWAHAVAPDDQPSPSASRRRGRDS